MRANVGLLIRPVTPQCLRKARAKAVFPAPRSPLKCKVAAETPWYCESAGHCGKIMSASDLASCSVAASFSRKKSILSVVILQHSWQEKSQATVLAGLTLALDQVSQFIQRAMVKAQASVPIEMIRLTIRPSPPMRMAKT